MRARGPWILAACRTPIGRFLGALASQTAVELGVAAARAALERAGIEPASVDEAIVGNVLSAGLGQAPARQVALAAGMSATASALTVNMVCGSGLRAVMLGAGSIRSCESSLVLAGGMESMSNAPHLVRNCRSGWKLGDAVLLDHLMYDGLRCATEGWPMGQAAEYTARAAGLTRAAIDAYSVESHRRAVDAQQRGAFQGELMPVFVRGKKGETCVDVDEGPRADTSLESLARLAPSFEADGMVTAGNSSQLSDGAAMVVLSAEPGSAPLARVLAWATAGRAPRDLFFAPIDAVRRVLEKAELAIGDVDLFELNEAFAAQVIADIQALDLDPAKVNVHGGAVALGHPIGASGARVLVTLVHALRARGGRFGCAALCLGGGNAVAMLIERV